MSVFMIQVRLFSLDLEVFCLYRSSKNLVGFPSTTFRNTEIKQATLSVSASQTHTALTLLPIMVTMSTLLLVNEGHHLALPPCDPIIPIAFSCPSLVATVPIVSSSLQRRVIQSSSGMLGLPSKTFFLQFF